ncbi:MULTISPECIES: DUF3122 domain-containing protein [unclassified Synechocystis]|uniref:DUF3122 domain-containing protein n=1 Tax=unclassified Synechocystis TaxID=2640012 RepID=UPI00041F5166|nr:MULTISPECIES: DUF3122 domain-containing protein [unclassified Synechocystis]AIE75201.1 hypothetical protein D082_26730 [Synechocystis sp. PCC 6714]MCT0252956.1 DUF3122 domain-containing protein [Synechocystis sp. CS-94]
MASWCHSLFRRWGKVLTLAVVSFGFCCSCFTLWPGAAPALVREITEQPGQTLSQSRQSLRDQTGKTWQVVLFKRVKANGKTETNLRLVGFPGVTSFRHPAPLVVRDNSGNTINLTDLLVEESPGANVGQFLVTVDFTNLEINGIWELDLPLEGQDQQIKVPYFVLQEWQGLLANTPD